MHAVDIIIVVSIACMIGITPVLYVRKDLLLAIGYLVGSTIGTFAGSHIALWYFPQSDKPGIIIGALIGALLPVAAWHLMRKNSDKR